MGKAEGNEELMGGKDLYFGLPLAFAKLPVWEEPISTGGAN